MPRIQVITCMAYGGTCLVLSSKSIGAELVSDYTEKYANPYVAAGRGFVDDVIDPAETRIKLVEGLRILRTKHEDSPQRKHGNIPL